MLTSTISYICGNHFKVSNDGRIVTVKEGEESLYLNLVQWTKEPLSADNRIFKVEILEGIPTSQICMIGTNPKLEAPPPIWNLHKSCRYNSNDGGVFTEGKGHKTFRTYGKIGDVIMIYLEHIAQERCLLNFFLNSTLVFRQWVSIRFENLHPAIGISNGPARFRASWPGVIKDLDTDLRPLSSWLRHPAIITNDQTNVLECTENLPQAFLSAQAPRPIGKDHSYFEIKVLNISNPKFGPAIGLTQAVSDRLASYPGWNFETVGYHGDGGIYVNDDGTCESMKPSKDTMVTVDDRMGCGVMFEPGQVADCRTPQLVIVYFTKNGAIIHSKPRLLPEAGFYPVVTLPEKGDKVIVYHPATPPETCKELETEFTKWQPLYSAFRFSESIEFTDYNEEHHLFNKVQICGKKDVPQILQYTKEAKDSYYFQFKIIRIGVTTEFKVSAAERTILTQTEMLPHDSTHKTFTINGSGDETVTTGDKVEVFIDTIEPGKKWQTVAVNSKIVFREEICFDSKATVHPTMCFKNGPIKLDIDWPDKADAENQTIFTLGEISHWRHGPGITVSATDIACSSLPDKTSCTNILAPVPVKKHGAFFFQIKLEDQDGQFSMFPGVGVTSGISPVQTKTLTILKQASSAFFYGSTQSLVTWKGTTQAKDAVEGMISSVGCSVIPVHDSFILTFHCNGESVLSHKMKAPPGGIYPVISFQTGTQGQKFKIEVLDTESLDKNIAGEVLNLSDTCTSDLDWKKHADAVMSALPGFEVSTDEKFSSIESVYISHEIVDIQQIEKIVYGLHGKGYKVQTTTWNIDNQRKFMLMGMSSVVIVCLSSSSLNSKTMLAEVRHITTKNIPMLPICLGSVAWPPGGILREGLAMFERYSTIKLDFYGSIRPEHINKIEHHMSLAVGLSLQPVVVEALSSVFPGNTDKDHESDLDSEFDDKDDVPSAVTYDLDTDPSSPRAKKLQFFTKKSKEYIESSACHIL